MTQATQVQAIGAPIQQLWSDSVAIALEGFAASQAQGKQWLESTFELGAASAKDSLKYAEELRGRLAEATSTANELLKEQVALFNELPKDPVAATQKVISAYVEGSRKVRGAEGLRHPGQRRLVAPGEEQPGDPGAVRRLRHQAAGHRGVRGEEELTPPSPTAGSARPCDARALFASIRWC